MQNKISFNNFNVFIVTEFSPLKPVFSKHYLHRQNTIVSFKRINICLWPLLTPKHAFYKQNFLNYGNFYTNYVILISGLRVRDLELKGQSSYFSCDQLKKMATFLTDPLDDFSNKLL